MHVQLAVACLIVEKVNAKLFKLDGVTYSADELTDTGRKLLVSLNYSAAKIIDLRNYVAILTRAKQGYISDISFEVVESKSGVDLNQLFGEE